ncbi:hypothetical protein Q1695_006400 [Nippostrongylus brasiliensis]|nr:hypothetical protein Q1695_006400 [Nippostrongylus brasiliensis]
MWQTPLSAAIAASQGQTNNNLLQQISMLHNLHHPHQQPSFNYLQVAVASTHATNQPPVVKQEVSDLRISSGFAPLSASNGCSSQALGSSYNNTSKNASVTVSSPIVPFSSIATSSSPACKRPCYSPPEDSTSRELQLKRNSPDDNSPKTTLTQSSTVVWLVWKLLTAEPQPNYI